MGLGGEALGLSFALILLILVLVLADRLFLVAVRAKEIDQRNHDLYFLLQNLSCFKGLEGVRLYRTHALTPNVYCIHPYFNQPCILIPDEILKTEDHELWEASIRTALNFIHTRRGRFSGFLSFLCALIFAPVYLLKSLRLKWLSILYGYLFLPFIYIKDFVIESSLRRNLDLQNESESTRLTYFLEKFGSRETSFINDLALDFSIFRRRDMSLWPSILGSYSNFSNQVLRWHERKN